MSAADDQRRGDPLGFARLDAERLGRELAEAAQLELDAIQPLREVEELVGAVLFRHRRAHDVVCTSVSVTVAPGNTLAGVGDDADDGAVGRLRGGDRRNDAETDTITNGTPNDLCTDLSS